MPATVVYHANCPDGFCAAWLFSKVMPKATFVPANYGDSTPEVKNDHDFYIVDFSYPKDQLVDLAERANQVVVLDRHKTAQSTLGDINHPRAQIVFDMEKSGARLAWEYLYQYYTPGEEILSGSGAYGFRTIHEVPNLVLYTEDRDLWRHQLPSTHEVNAAIRSYPQEFLVWDRLHFMGVETLAREGETILRYRRQRIEDMKSLAVWGNILGYKVPVVNCGIKDIQSEVADELAAPFAACWYELEKGRFSYTLRSRGDFDVSSVAIQFGGGGHKNAAGFETERIIH